MGGRRGEDWRAVFVARRENVVFLGPSVVVKRHLAIALHHKAANAGIKTRFTTVADLMLRVQTAARQDRSPDLTKKLSRDAPLITDEIDFLRAHLFFHIVTSAG